MEYLGQISAMDRCKDGRLNSIAIDLEDLERPRIGRFEHILQTMRVDGSRSFFGSIMEELTKMHMDIKAIGFEPWSESREEAERMGSLLNL